MLKKRKLIYLMGLILTSIQCSKTESILERAMSSPDSAIQRVVKQLDKHEVQLLLTQIDTNQATEMNFHSSFFNLDEGHYFYPASTAKLPIAALTLQKLRELQSSGILIDADTPFTIRTQQGVPVKLNDPSQEEGALTFSHLIKKIFLVSDNDAYNYLFDFLGRDYINSELKGVGLNNTQIFHKFLFGADNETTWEYTFFNSEGDTLYHQGSITSSFKQSNQNLKGVVKGKGFLSEGTLVNSPMDFSKKNRISILDLEGILKRLMFPQAFPKSKQFRLADTDYEFLRFWMSRSTLESQFPNYDNGEYWDSYNKFFIHGDQKGMMTDQIRIHNKVGYAYGTLTDVAFIQDKEFDLAFFLTATILVNENEIFNDDIYEFDNVGIPFLASLGRFVLEELRKNKSAIKEP